MTAWIRERCVYAPTLTPRWLVDLRKAERLPYPPQIASHVGVSVSSAVPSRAALCYLAAAWRADTLFCCMAAQQQNQKPHGFKRTPSKKHSRGSVRPARTATACKAGYQPGSDIALHTAATDPPEERQWANPRAERRMPVTRDGAGGECGKTPDLGAFAQAMSCRQRRELSTVMTTAGEHVRPNLGGESLRVNKSEETRKGRISTQGRQSSQSSPALASADIVQSNEEER